MDKLEQALELLEQLTEDELTELIEHIEHDQGRRFFLDN